MLLVDWPSPSIHPIGPTEVLSYSCEAPFVLMRASQSIVQASCCRKHANSRYTLSKALVFKDNVLAANSRSFLPESATSVLATLHHEVLWQYSGLLLAQRFGNATRRERRSRCWAQVGPRIVWVRFLLLMQILSASSFVIFLIPGAQAIYSTGGS